MAFNSFSFLIFFPTVALFYFLLPQKLKTFWLLSASYFFYMSWNASYGLLLLFSTAVSFFGANILNKIKNIKIRKLFLFTVLFILFAVLIFYKYTDFILRNISIIFRLFGKETPHVMEILLPVGISFFTFQTAGYVIDVYRNDIAPEKSFFRYALFISFFPQLVAGPIERSRNLLKQFYQYPSFDFEKAKEGVLTMIWGFFLKMVVADRAAVFVNAAYTNYLETEGLTLVFATILFAFQIYGDFCGYSLIARGCAKILGFDLMENFDSPYFALSVQDFWRRWHISLSTWFRDYIYFPLGGSRCSKIKTYINIMTVMTISGLWHGAGWRFVIWGMLHGALQIWDRATAKIQKKISPLIRRFATFFWICIGWCIFRAPSPKGAFVILKKMGEFILKHMTFHQANMGLNAAELRLLLVSIILVLAADAFKYKGISVRKYILKCDAVTQIFCIAISVVFIIIFGVWGGDYNAADFIYFKF